LVDPAAGQDYSYVDYTVKDGLAGTTTYCMVRDRDGFLWFGTETGLSRFDGSHFRNFYMSDGLPDNEIIKLFVDSRNRVWIVPFKNSLCYYRNGKIFNQQNDSLVKKLGIRGEVVSVVEDKQGNVIVAEASVIHILSPAGAITHVQYFNGSPLLLWQAGINDRGNCRFILGRNGLAAMFVDLENGALVQKGYFPGFGENNYTSTYISPGLEIYEEMDSLVFLHTRENRQSKLLLPKGFIYISRIDDSSVMLNAYSSTYLYNTRQNKIIDSFLPGKVVNGTMEDPEGGLWFSTLGAGLFRLASRDVKRYNFRERNTDLPVFCIRRIGGTLYVGTDRFYLWSGLDNGKPFHPQKIDDKVSPGRITSIIDGGERGILAGTDAGVFGVSGRTVSGDGRDGDTRSSGWRTLWHRGAVKTLWRLNDSLVLDFSGASVRMVRLRDGEEKSMVWPGRSTCGWITGDRCYVGTLTGLYAVSLSVRDSSRRNTVERNAKMHDTAETLLKSRISAIAAADGGLWVATYGEGLVFLKNDRPVRRITVEDGLTSDICRCLFADGKSVWVGTDKGLNKIVRVDSGYVITHFTASEGLGSDIINTIYLDGRKLYAGTPVGMTVFDADRNYSPSECRLRLTGIHVAGNPWPLDTANFTLPFSNNDLQIEYVGISYRGSGAIEYRYRLLGIDDRWGTTDQTFLHYPSLPPGQYELQLLAINPSGAISSTLRLPFSIAEPWWQKVWVRVLLGLVLAGIIWWVFQLRVRTIQRKEAEKTATAARMAELEQMALRSRMNPHFIFNCLNSIQLFVVEKDIRGANEYITHFSRLIRLTLDISARAYLSLQEEINYLSTYLELEKRRFEQAFDYEIFVAADIDKRAQMIPPLILQPYVENAILHGITHRRDRQGRIRVIIRKDAHYLICIIEDNGVGRERAAQYKSREKDEFPSRGMELTARRIDILNSTMANPISTVVEDITVEGGRRDGTRVIVRFPL
jgi:ligand-binding sensor domain-containing protein